jgi:hypothetical protein
MTNDLKNIYYGVVQKYKTDDKAGDITAGTPFIKLTSDTNGEDLYININNISEISPYLAGATINMQSYYTNVKESSDEILELIKNKYI